MKATIKFNLDDADDLISYKRTNKSLDMAIVLFEISNNLKRDIENKLDNKEYGKYEAIDLVFEEISQLLHEHKIDLEEIIY